MRLESIAIKGLGPFADEVSVDLTQVDGRIVAVCGGNGAGKSTLLELWAGGALYRGTPTRGSLADLATARDAYLEARVVNGKAWTIRHTVDSRNGKGESIVLDAEGKSVLPSGKVRDFDRWAATTLPSPEVLYSTVFAPQGSAGFLGLKAGERKAVLLRALGVERLEALADAARDRTRSSKATVSTAAARLADEQRRGGNIDQAREEMAAAQTRAADAERKLDAARIALSVVEEDAVVARERRREIEALSLKRAELQQLQEAARMRAENLTGRIQNNEGLLAQAEAIRAAAARLPELDRELAAAASEERSERERAADVRQRAGRTTEAHAKASIALHKAEARVSSATEAARVLAGARRAAEGIEGAQDEVVRQAAVVAEAEAELERLRGLRVAGAEQRTVDLRTGLELVRDGCENPARIAGNALDLDDQRVVLAAELPGKSKGAELLLTTARHGLDEMRLALRFLEATAAQSAQAERIVADGEAAAAEVEAAKLDCAACLQQGGELAAQERGCLERADDHAEWQQLLRRERVGLEPMAKLSDRLAQADARIAELAPQLHDATAEVARCQGELALLSEPGELPAVPDVASYRAAVERATEEAGAVDRTVGACEHRVEIAERSAVRAVELEAELRAAEAELADWTRLADDLGRDGLQALEIDAAGPELTELCNDLLHTCVGSRWTVSIETTKASADGKRTLEGCEVRVIDSERGRDAAAETLSGGERVLVGEAISLALTMLACRRQGVTGATLVRDETGAALEPERGRAYVSMLRRAADLVGARQVLFVSHSPELQELADARIVVAGGRVEVQ